MIASPRTFRILAIILAAGAGLVGAVALIGRLYGIETLRTLAPGLTPMQVTSATCVLALGIALCITARWPTTRSAILVGRALALAAIAVAVFTLAEYAFVWKVGIEEALFRGGLSQASSGRMGTNTAGAILLLGIATALITGASKSSIKVAQTLALGSAAVALTSLVGYIYSATDLYQMRSATPMAVNTAVALTMLCGALLWTKPYDGFMRAVHAADSAGLMLRRLIPAAIVVPVILGWLRLVGQRDGLYDTTFGAALLVLSTITIFVVLIVVNARSVKALDATRDDARAELEATFGSVERQVEERTHELHDALARLADSEQRLELATEGSNSGILDLDLVANSLFCNRRWHEMLGRRGERMSVSGFVELVHPDDREHAMALFVAHLKGQADFSAEVRMRHADGSYRWMLSRGRAVRDESGRAFRMLGSQTDITEIKALQDALRDASIRDGLTGLYNRTHFIERLASAARLAVRHKFPLSFCMCDVDRFKAINDTFGHQAGDSVIQAVGKAIAAEIRAEDVAARYGGDEFCIMFEATLPDQAAACAERIRAHVGNMPFFMNDGRPFSVSLSMGISELSAKSVPELIEAADQALYAAKSAGRNRIVLDSAPPVIRRTAAGD